MKIRCLGCLGFAAVLLSAAGSSAWEQERSWSLSKAVEILNSSPWARQETFTRVISGVGSGVSGEKEIFNTFYVRLLSAGPIRAAYARILQLRCGYDAMGDEDRRRFDNVALSRLAMDADRWIVVAVSFRSNDPNEESTVRRYFQTQTTETLKAKAFLSSERFAQIPVHAYFPPRDEAVGAKFVFPKDIEGKPLVSPVCKQVFFELLGVPGAEPHLRSSFHIKQMIVGGIVVL